MSNEYYRKHFPLTLREMFKRAYIYTNVLIKNEFQAIPSLTFLYGHHLFIDEVENFKITLSYLKKNFTIISFSEAIAKLSSKSVIDKPYICFSFDDGFKNNLLIADYLEAEGISSMFFVNPEVVHNCNNEVYIKKHCIEKLSKRDQLNFMSWDDLEYLKRTNHEVGNHSLNHRILTKLTEQELLDDLAISKQILDSRIGRTDHFAYPYGQSKYFNQNIFDIARQTGHLSISTGIRGTYLNESNIEITPILRDLIVFNDPVYYYNFFYKLNIKKAVKKSG